VNHCDSHYDSVCKDEFSSINAKLDRLDEAIRGNGKPGIALRLDRLEQNAMRYSRLVWLAGGAVFTSAASVLVAWVTG
jgi:hypothetical protein